MRALKTEVEIAAPIDQVWNALVDFENWKSWNLTVDEVLGDFKLNSKIMVTMRAAKGKKPMSYAAEIVEVDENKSYRWRATMMAGFLFTNYKVFTLEATETGTKLTHNEEFTGLLVPLFWKKMETGAVPLLKLLNRGLKKSLEKKQPTK